jgi:cytochrome P450
VHAQGPPQSRAPSFVEAAVQRQILFADDERQQRVQHIIQKESARKVRTLVPALRENALSLLNRARARGQLDLQADFATPYALDTICRVMGVPASEPEHLSNLAEWSTTYANLTSGYLLVKTDHVRQLGDHFRRIVATKDEDSDDLAGALARAGCFDDHDDLIINCMMAFTAGRVTTQKLLGDGLPLLMPLWAELRAARLSNPRMVHGLTEELLRAVTPTRYVARIATEDLILPDGRGRDHEIRRGSRIVLFLESANRDPNVFDTPHTFTPTRSHNAHVAFGHGSHKCPGATLARLEIHIAIEAALETFTELRPDFSRPRTWDPNPNIGGYTSYPCFCE